MGNSPVTGEFPAQSASKAEYVSIWWRHLDSLQNGPDQIPEGWDAMTIIENFVNAGGNFIDTADVYGAGSTQEIVGSIISERFTTNT